MAPVKLHEARDSSNMNVSTITSEDISEWLS